MILRYCWAAEEVVVLKNCAFVLWIFFVRGMQEIIFYNIMYAYVCKICEEKFGGCWWSFSWLGQSVLLDSKVNKKTSYWYCLSLYHYYKRMRNSVAYCCRNLVVNQRKALLTNRLALCYDSWTNRRHRDVLLFRNADRNWILIGCIEQDGHVHAVDDLARFTHFNTTFWGNY